MTKSLLACIVAALVAAVSFSAQAVGIDVAALITPDVAMGLTLAGAAMSTNYIQDGDVIQYTAGATHAAGDVIKMGGTLGVALVDLTSGVTGSVAIQGVFELPKVTGAVIAQGESLVWDVSAGKFDDNLASPASGDVSGASAIAWESAGNGVTTLAVRLTGVAGTVTA